MPSDDNLEALKAELDPVAKAWLTEREDEGDAEGLSPEANRVAKEAKRVVIAAFVIAAVLLALSLAVFF